MDFFIILLLISIFILPGLLKKNGKGKPNSRRKDWLSPQGQRDIQSYINSNPADDFDDDDDEWEDKSHNTLDPLTEVRSRIMTMSVNQARQYAAHKAGKRLSAKDHYHDPIKPDPPKGDSPDADDMNRRRHSNWGERARPGVLSTGNILIVIAAGLVLIILMNISANLSG